MPRNRKNTRLLLASVLAEGTRPCVAESAGSTTAAAVFEACVERWHRLTRALRAGRSLYRNAPEHSEKSPLV